MAVTVGATPLDRIELAELAERYEGFADRIADLARQRTLQEARRADEPSDEPTGDERLLEEVEQEQRDGDVSQPKEEL